MKVLGFGAPCLTAEVLPTVLGRAGHEFVEQDLKLEQANDGRDALAKAIYSRLFDRLVEVRTGTRLRHRWRPTALTPRSSRYS